MAIFGWIVLLLVTIYAVIVATIAIVMELGLSGKLSPSTFIPAVLALVMIVFTYNTFPFTVTVQ